jgi:hypothetical protein
MPLACRRLSVLAAYLSCARIMAVASPMLQKKLQQPASRSPQAFFNGR